MICRATNTTTTYLILFPRTSDNICPYKYYIFATRAYISRSYRICATSSFPNVIFSGPPVSASNPSPFYNHRKTKAVPLFLSPPSPSPCTSFATLSYPYIPSHIRACALFSPYPPLFILGFFSLLPHTHHHHHYRHNRPHSFFTARYFPPR